MSSAWCVGNLVAGSERGRHAPGGSAGEPKLRSIAVVGAGFAGLAAARRLAQTGAAVVVFDKARRPGGRVSTRRAQGFAFDDGAQYFTCRAPAFEAMVAEWCARGVAAPWNARVATLDAGARCQESSDTERYVGVPTMSALARDLAEGLRVECKRRIERVERAEGSWRVAWADGQSHDGFGAVLIATPAPQAVPLLAARPALARRVSAVEMQACHAAMVAFARPLGADFAGAFVANSPLSWVACNASKPGRAAGECWVLHTTPEWSAAHLEDSPEVISAKLLGAFAHALGSDLPPTVFCTAHRWRFARTDRPLGTPFLWDSRAGLGVCGDWSFGGRVENAFLSGDSLARAVLADPPDGAAPRSGPTA